MKFAELFAGAGGLSRGLEAAGMTCTAHAEIEPHARAVLRYQWPTVRLDGDVTQINGADYAGIDLLSGGSPCQDMSVAGKRAGLAGSRSSLFHEQIRIWHESQARYLLWENVPGAFSSNAGADFAAVLSAIVGCAVAVRRDGWTAAGVVAGPTAVAAWRVFDLQHVGPPQRRARVFVLAARAGGVDPAEVLALSEGVCGHPSPREQTRQDVTGTLSARTHGGGGPGTDFELNGGVQVVGTLTVGGRDKGAGDSYDNTPVVVVGWSAQQITSAANQSRLVPEMSPTLSARGMEVLAFHPTQDPCSSDELSYALGRTTGGMAVLAFDEYNQASADVCATLRTPPAWPPIVARIRGFGDYELSDHASAIKARDGKDATDLVVTDRARRLMPVETERLMSWPDHWTATGIDERGRTYALSDTARYKLCGNGVGSVVAEWIGRRLMWAEAAC